MKDFLVAEWWMMPASKIRIKCNLRNKQSRGHVDNPMGLPTCGDEVGACQDCVVPGRRFRRRLQHCLFPPTRMTQVFSSPNLSELAYCRPIANSSKWNLQRSLQCLGNVLGGYARNSSLEHIGKISKKIVGSIIKRRMRLHHPDILFPL